MYLSHRKAAFGGLLIGDPYEMLGQVGYRSLAPKRPAVGDLVQRTWGEG